MLQQVAVVCLLASRVWSLMLPDQQVFLDIEREHPPKANIIHELHRAEIIPTVIDDFTPFVDLSITWEDVSAELGNTVSPSDVQNAPNFHFSDLHNKQGEKFHKTQLTVVLTDPDAPSRDNPEWSQICHWIFTGDSLKDIPPGAGPPNYGQDGKRIRVNKSREIMPWKPPGPPPKTGKHRYVFLVLAPANGTTDPLEPSKPTDRQHWGYDSERAGVREWAGKNGLVVIGANFIYAQNDEQ